MNLSSMIRLRVLPENWSWNTESCSKMFVQMLTSTVASFTQCLVFREELFTPIFAIARMPGWSAHRLEELISANKIIRPAYKYVGHHADFVPLMRDNKQNDKSSGDF